MPEPGRHLPRISMKQAGRLVNDFIAMDVPRTPVGIDPHSLRTIPEYKRRIVEPLSEVIDGLCVGHLVDVEVGDRCAFLVRKG